MATSRPEIKLLHQFLSIALGGNAYLHPSINESYHQNEWEYYEAYERSGLKGNPLFSMYSTKNEEKIRQAAGIIEWCYLNRQFTLLDQLIKKGYKFVSQYFQRHSPIDFEHFILSYAKRKQGKTVKQIELTYQNIVLWYLCIRENKPIDTDNITWHSFQEVLQSIQNEAYLEELNFSDEMFDTYREEINSLYEEYKIPKKPRFDSLGVFLEYLIGCSVKKISETNPFADPEQMVFQEPPAKYIGALGGWLKALKVHELDVTEQIPFTKRDLDQVFLELLYAKKYNQIAKEEQDLFFMSSLYLKCLSIHYRETKRLYLDQSKQDFYLEIKAKEARIREQEADLLRRQQEWEMTHNKQQRKLDGLIQELRAAQSNIRQLEQQLASMEDYRAEVYALRSIVHREELAELAEDPVPAIQTMLERIQSKRIVIFGGDLNWQQKLKELLPAVEFVDVDEKNRDFSKIQRMDAVFINTTVFAHSFYQKIIKELSNSETPLYYLSGQRNREKTILEVYRWMD